MIGRRPADAGGAPPAPEADDAAILEAIADVARRHLGWDGDLQLDRPLVESLALDSLRRLTLVVEIENRFLIRLDDGSEAGIETVRDLVEVVRRKLDVGEG